MFLGSRASSWENQRAVWPAWSGGRLGDRTSNSRPARGDADAGCGMGRGNVIFNAKFNCRSLFPKHIRKNVNHISDDAVVGQREISLWANYDDLSFINWKE